MEFKPAQADKMTRWTTVIFTVAVVGLAAGALVCWQIQQLEPFFGLAMMAVILALTLGITRLFCPLSYTVTPDGLSIRRVGAGTVFIPWAMVETAYRPEGITIWNITKTTGASGLYGHFGGFRIKDIGACWLSATNLYKLVVLHGDKNWVISPEESEAFLEYSKSYIEQASSLREQLKANFPKAR